MTVVNQTQQLEKWAKSFIMNKLFKTLDNKISNENGIINMKKLFRPIGFNLVLQACFGKELLDTLNDPFWIEWEKLSEKSSKDVIAQVMITLLFGKNNLLSNYLRKAVSGSSNFATAM